MNTPHDDQTAEPRLVTVSRRAVLRRGALVGALVALPGLACSKSDAEVFSDGSTTTLAGAADGTADTDAAESTTTTTSASENQAEEPATSTTTTDAALFPAGAELAVSFTYEPSGGGRVLNPYVAVWVEDAAGNLVDTISLWYEQSREGTRWLADLRSWYTASNRAADTTMSGATRIAGAYTVVWDGTDHAGDTVAQGDYVLYIEAAREHGPYSITSTPIAVGDTPFTVALDDDGEIVDASVELTT